MTNKFSYHERMEIIVAQDIRYVRKKDVHYDASWKTDGGPGAYFTMKRPMDRFHAIAKRNGYDIFKVIREEGLEGPDGSLIACVRDARRYLLLLEAELTEQLIVQQTLTAKERVQPAPRSTVSAEPTQSGTPEDGGHHARQPVPDDDHGIRWPWVASWGDLNTVPAECRDIWTRAAPGIFVIEPRLTIDEHSSLPFDIQDLYSPVFRIKPEYDMPTDYGNGRYGEGELVSYWLNLTLAPRSERDRWRSMKYEQNLKEAECLMEYIELYSWNANRERYLLRRMDWMENN